MAEFECELIVERTRIGSAAAPARERLSGGHRKMDVTILRLPMCPMAYRGTNAHDFAKRLGICTSTVMAR